MKIWIGRILVKFYFASVQCQIVANELKRSSFEKAFENWDGLGEMARTFRDRVYTRA